MRRNSSANSNWSWRVAASLPAPRTPTSQSAAAILDRWGHLESIPADPLEWDAGVRGAAKLNATLREQFELALLFRRIATVERDADVGTVDQWRWTGPTEGFAAVAEALGDPRLVERATRLAAKVGA
jgi:hypothetical protein